MAAKNTACVSFDSDPSAPDNLATLFTLGTAAGLELAKPDGTPNTSRVVCYAARAAVESAETIATLRAELAAAKGITPAPTDAERLAAAMRRAGLDRTGVATLLGISGDVVRNAQRGLKMGPALRAWVAEQEAEVAT